MKHTRTIRAAVTVVATIGLIGIGGAQASAGKDGPTCSGVGGIANHGQHVVGDYVIGGQGMGSDKDWPYPGEVGAQVSENGGAAVPGGPGPGFHFPNNFPPGASFCIDQARSGGR